MAILKVRDNMIDYRKVCLYTIMFILNCFACQDATFGAVVAMFEAAYVIFTAIFGRIGEALIAHNLCLGFSLEVSLFIFNESRIMYSYAYWPYIHRWGPLCVEIGLLLLLVIGYNGRICFFSSYGLKKSWLNRFSASVTSMICIGCGVSLISMLFNDNGIMNFSWYSGTYLTQICYWLILLGNIILIHFFLTKKDGFANQLRSALVSFFVSMVFSTCITILLGMSGRYSYHINIVLMPLVVFFGCGLVVFPFFKNYEHKSLLWYGIIMCVCLVYRMTPLSGKWFLYLLMLGFTLLIVNFTGKRFVKAILIVLVLGLLCVTIGEKIIASSELFSYKFEQAMSILTGAKAIKGSPLVRLEESANIAMEYLHKPWCFLFGKGIGGSIKHWLQWTDWSDPNAFVSAQSSSGVFVSMHESWNVLFLNFGAIGVCFFIEQFITSLKNIRKSPWIILGITWFIFFINCYISMYIMISVLMLGMFEVDEQRNN